MHVIMGYQYTSASGERGISHGKPREQYLLE